MSRVFVIHLQVRWNAAEGRNEGMHDLSPALEFGELEFLLPPDASPSRPEEALKTLHETLQDFRPEDYLLLIGNPCFIGWATAIAADWTDGRLRLLQWDRVARKYAAIEVDLFGEAEDAPQSH